jgi:hypothetical protein
MSTQIVLKNVRLSYCYAVKGKLNDRAQSVWSTTVLVPKNHPQLEDIKSAINAAKVAGAAKLGKGAVKSPLLDGDAKNDDGSWKYGGEENRGNYLLRAANYNRAPKVVDQQKNDILDADQLYSGCYANVVLNFYAYSAEGGKNKGISPGLEAIQKKRDGERLSGGGVNVNDVFDTEDDDDFLN